MKDLEKRIAELEKKLEDHEHLGNDGSKELTSGNVRFSGKEFVTTSIETENQEYIPLQFRMVDGSSVSPSNKREGGTALMVLGKKETKEEQIHFITGGGKKMNQDDLVPQNRADFDKVNAMQVIAAYNPQGESTVSGPSNFPPFGFLYAYRTPTILSTGTISGSTLTDEKANFKPNQLNGSIITILSATVMETRKVVSHTSDTITVDKEWIAPAGDYQYQLVAPVFLGAATIPFTRLYVGDDIRLGYGSSGGGQVRYIKWGTGSPEGVVVANIGSLYLREDGSTNTTLYIKTANNGQATGWTAK
jgi:hypothetical protein